MIEKEKKKEKEERHSNMQSVLSLKDRIQMPEIAQPEVHYTDLSPWITGKKPWVQNEEYKIKK